MSRTDEPRALRAFGQNFLANPSLAEWLVERFDPRPGDRIVEIGPGLGAITASLVERAGRVVAIELDERLLDPLRERFGDAVDLRHVDALEVGWDALAVELGGDLRIIGNLPYNVGTAILRRVLAAARVRDVQLVLQKEVCERIVADAGTKTYGPLSVIAALRARRRRLRTLAPGAFRPRPKVTSAAISLATRDDAPLAAKDVAWMESWLFRGFAQRRKTLASNLPEHRDRLRALLEAAGLPADARAEAVPPETWLAIARHLEAAG